MKIEEIIAPSCFKRVLKNVIITDLNFISSNGFTVYLKNVYLTFPAINDIIYTIPFSLMLNAFYDC